MNKGIRFIVCASLLLIVACNKSNISKLQLKNEIEKIVIPEDIENGIPWYNILDSLSVIRLETNQDCGMGIISRIIYHNGFFYIHDVGNHRILVFNSEGRFISKLEKKGAGPKEYIELRDFTLDDKFIYILSYRKMLKYTLDFEFVNDLVLKFSDKDEQFSPTQFVKFDEIFYFWGGSFAVNKENNSVFSLIKTDSKIDIIESKFPVKRKIISSRKFNVCENYFSFSFFWGNDTIYELTNNVNPKYYVDFGINKVEEKDIPEGFDDKINKFFLKLRESDKSGNISNIIEDEKLLYFTFVNKGRMFHSIYSKENNTLMSGRIAFSQPLSPLVIQGKIREKYFSVIESYILKDFLDKTYEENSSYKFMEELLDVNIDDNPILLIFKLKS